METRKYPRTYHFPFSPGAQNDDRVQDNWQSLLSAELVLTEKLDGENSCLKASGVYARSHAAPTRNPWAQNLWPVWERVKNDLGDVEVFGENLYGIHSIEYAALPAYFFVFAVREGQRWWSWDEVLAWAALLDLPPVPVRAQGCFDETALRYAIREGMTVGSVFGGSCEGFVAREREAFSDADFSQKVLKYVREGHVQTDEHWTRHWKKAKLKR